MLQMIVHMSLKENVKSNSNKISLYILFTYTFYYVYFIVDKRFFKAYIFYKSILTGTICDYMINNCEFCISP
jgi:hypothetical protein